eukprot:CAMPEP_0201582114 /NCGR_PEP_ID=MMETSP0190_2-20130828/80233_1 /ASSEMBLY_ACC=CAM_ASM_000263 /TAXON_ID=37353 /ORGANISM="Rosalina sp." /LENGTH=85 /DNA_ID=CAMNT_0048021375 /DNA_START=24 /DNA_END=277 /DNA_ORIENTATION=+
MLALLILSAIIGASMSATYLSDSDLPAVSSGYNGKSTFYGGNVDGNACGFFSNTFKTSSFPFGYYAACGSDAFDSGYGCGNCYEV